MKVLNSPRAVRYVPANNSTFSPFSPQRIARKLEIKYQLESHKQIRTIHLFLGVSTALIMRAPLVPGSFRYCNFGGGSGGGGSALNHLLVSASAAEIVGGKRSSDRLLSAVLIILEKNREREFVGADEEGTIEVGDTM